MPQVQNLKVYQGFEITEPDIYNAVDLIESVEPGWSEVYIKGLLEIFKHFKDPFIMVKNDEEPIGFFVVLVVEKFFISEWCAGKHNHEFLYLEFPDGTLLHPQPDTFLHVLIELIAIKPGWDTFAVMPIMMSKFAKYIQSLAAQNCFIEKVYSEAFSKKGQRLASFFGLEKVRDTEYGTLYASGSTPEKFTRLFPADFQKLNELYAQKFNTYKF